MKPVLHHNITFIKQPRALTVNLAWYRINALLQFKRGCFFLRPKLMTSQQDVVWISLSDHQMYFSQTRYFISTFVNKITWKMHSQVPPNSRVWYHLSIYLLCNGYCLVRNWIMGYCLCFYNTLPLFLQYKISCHTLGFKDQRLVP